MTESFYLAASFLSGGVIGFLFFGGLLWTTLNGVKSDSAAFWFVGSFLLRTAMALAGFQVITNGDWRRGVACMLGFIVARSVMLRLSRMKPSIPVKVGHES